MRNHSVIYASMAFGTTVLLIGMAMFMGYSFQASLETGLGNFHFEGSRTHVHQLDEDR